MSTDIDSKHTINLQLVKCPNCGNHSPYTNTNECLVEGYPVCVCNECGDIFNRYLFDGEPVNGCRRCESLSISVFPNPEYVRCPKCGTKMERKGSVRVFSSYLENINYPLSLIIRNFKVAQKHILGRLRTELRKRYCDLSNNDKVDVLSAMLENDKKEDRGWAFAQMAFDEGFWEWLRQGETKAATTLKDLALSVMQKHLRQYEVATFAIEKMSLEYVKQRAQVFEEGAGYLGSWAYEYKLSEDPNYKINKSKLNIAEYYSILERRNRTISEGEAVRDWMFLIHKDWSQEQFSINRYVNELSDVTLTAIDELKVFVEYVNGHCKRLSVAIAEINEKASQEVGKYYFSAILTGQVSDDSSLASNVFIKLLELAKQYSDELLKLEDYGIYDSADLP